MEITTTLGLSPLISSSSCLGSVSKMVMGAELTNMVFFSACSGVSFSSNPILIIFLMLMAFLSLCSSTPF